jgi:hypothetical protein
MLGTNPLESYSSTIRHVLHSRSKYSYRFDSTQMDPRYRPCFGVEPQYRPWLGVAPRDHPCVGRTGSARAFPDVNCQRVRISCGPRAYA